SYCGKSRPTTDNTTNQNCNSSTYPTVTINIRLTNVVRFDPTHRENNDNSHVIDNKHSTVSNPISLFAVAKVMLTSESAIDGPHYACTECKQKSRPYLFKTFRT